MAVIVSPPPPKSDRKFDDWMYLLWKRVNIFGFLAGDGAGGSVVQTTDKTTSVTLNSNSGTVTTHSQSVASLGRTEFVLHNSLISTTDNLVVTLKSGGTPGAYLIQVTAVASGQCTILIMNLSSGALAESLQINFIVIKSP